MADGLNNAGWELWTVASNDDVAQLSADTNLPGIRYNTVYFAAGSLDFYHGGPGGLPVAVQLDRKLPSSAADGPADLAILDTGLPPDYGLHPADLQAVQGRVDVPDSTDALDEDKNGKLDLQAAHGMFICGLVRQATPDVGIDMYRVLNATGEGDEATIIAKLNLVLDTDARVVSLSFGGFPARDDEPEPPLAATIRKLKQEGKVVVAAAGNVQQLPEYRGRTMFPASLPEVIAVGAVDWRKTEEALWVHSNPADVYSVGVDLVSTYVGWENEQHVPTLNAWVRWSGTSFATPVVAARYATEPGIRPAMVGSEAPHLPQKSVWPPPPAGTGLAGQIGVPRRLDPDVDLTR